MISERQDQIIKILVKEYIKNAEPVSSKFLAEKHDFGICPSAIRIELQSLFKEGFLEQPHTSAGRIPTDKAYRLFVDNLLDKHLERIEERVEGIIEKLIREKQEELKMASVLAKYLADTSSNFIALHFYDEGVTLKEGINEIFKEPEFEDKDFISSFVNFFENFENNIKLISPDPGINIFIGEEVPIPKAKNITLICSECNFPSHKAFISILGPKRMDYNKNIALIKTLTKALKEFV